MVGIKSIMLNLIMSRSLIDDSTTKKLNHIKKTRARKNILEQKLVEAVSKLYYSKHSLLDKNIIRYITFLTNGPIKTNLCYEFTNWDSATKLVEGISSNSLK